MSLFDLLKRRPSPPADLRAALIDAAAREDWQGLAALCEQHQDQIRESFPSWKKVPDDVRSNPEAQTRYAQALIAVAQLFEQAGDGSLIASLMGNAADNPITAWERALATAQSLLEQGQSQEAADLLQSTLRRTESLEGSAADSYRPRTVGMLGVALFRSGDKTAGIEATRRARDLCKATGDAEGVAVYEANLQRMTGGPGVVFRDEAGEPISLADLQQRAGRFRYEIPDDAPVPPAAEELHQRGRRAGSRGDHDEAIALFEQAADLAPKWPYPVYDLAFTYLLKRDAPRAVEHYRKTLDLAPRGFFTAMTALHTLEREQRGELPAGLYLAYLSLEHIEDRAERARAARALTEKVPGFAPAWKDLAASLDQDAERLAAIRKGLAAGPDPETRGMLQLDEALVLHARGDRETAVRLLGELAEDPASTHAVEQLAKTALIAFKAG